MVTQFPVSNGSVIDGSDMNQSFFQGYLNGSMSYGNATLGTSEVQILSANSNRLSVLIRNNSSSQVFIGSTGVTTSNGLALNPDESVYLQTKQSVFGISGSAGVDVRYLEVTL